MLNGWQSYQHARGSERTSPAGRNRDRSRGGGGAERADARDAAQEATSSFRPGRNRVGRLCTGARVGRGGWGDQGRNASGNPLHHLRRTFIEMPPEKPKKPRSPETQTARSSATHSTSPIPSTRRTQQPGDREVGTLLQRRGVPEGPGRGRLLPPGELIVQARRSSGALRFVAKPSSGLAHRPKAPTGVLESVRGRIFLVPVLCGIRLASPVGLLEFTRSLPPVLRRCARCESIYDASDDSDYE